MRIYIIGTDGVTLCRETPATVNEGEIAVASKEELHAARLGGKRVLALWNALPGVEKRRKVGDREALVDQLWSAVEALPEPDQQSETKGPSKQAAVIAMLQRPKGATVEEVGPRAANENIGTGAAEEPVVAGASGQGIAEIGRGDRGRELVDASGNIDDVEIAARVLTERDGRDDRADIRVDLTRALRTNPVRAVESEREDLAVQVGIEILAVQPVTFATIDIAADDPVCTVLASGATVDLARACASERTRKIIALVQEADH